MLIMALVRSLRMHAVPFVVLAAAFGGMTHESRAADDPEACLARIRRAEMDPITCEIMRRATDAERASLKESTAGVLLDADCEARIVIPRRVVDQLRSATGPVDIPGQEVAYQIVTNGGPLRAVLEVGGRVVMANGRANDFVPSITIKRGLPLVLGRLLLSFAQSATDVRHGVVDTINTIVMPEPAP
jgi:hypothetical protein